MVCFELFGCAVMMVGILRAYCGWVVGAVGV